MTLHPQSPAVTVDTSDLHRALEKIFRRSILELQRRSSLYSSSFAIEDLDITFDGGDRTSVIFKNIGSEAMLDHAREVKPVFLYDPMREIQVYESVLSSLALGTPDFYGAVAEPAIGRYWLFLEKVSADRLHEVTGFESWLRAARWLAGLHASYDASAEAARAAAPRILEHDGSYYSQWLQRAHESVGSPLDRIIARYERVIGILLALPRTLIHGEFFSSNILIEGSRICPVDWEMAAIGPAFLDVAALASGNWNREERLRIAEAYHSALPHSLRPDDFMTAFYCCQLHIALQWLGWSQCWSPPATHAYDWLAEALRLCNEEPLASLIA